MDFAAEENYSEEEDEDEEEEMAVNTRSKGKMKESESMVLSKKAPAFRESAFAADLSSM